MMRLLSNHLDAPSPWQGFCCGWLRIDISDAPPLPPPFQNGWDPACLAGWPTRWLEPMAAVFLWQAGRNLFMRDIRGGAFAQEWAAEQRTGLKRLNELFDAALAHPMSKCETGVIAAVNASHTATTAAAATAAAAHAAIDDTATAATLTTGGGLCIRSLLLGLAAGAVAATLLHRR